MANLALSSNTSELHIEISPLQETLSNFHKVHRDIQKHLFAITKRDIEEETTPYRALLSLQREAKDIHKEILDHMEVITNDPNSKEALQHLSEVLFILRSTHHLYSSLMLKEAGEFVNDNNLYVKARQSNEVSKPRGALRLKGTYDIHHLIQTALLLGHSFLPLLLSLHETFHRSLHNITDSKQYDIATNESIDGTYYEKVHEITQSDDSFAEKVEHLTRLNIKASKRYTKRLEIRSGGIPFIRNASAESRNSLKRFADRHKDHLDELFVQYCLEEARGIMDSYEYYHAHIIDLSIQRTIALFTSLGKTIKQLLFYLLETEEIPYQAFVQYSPKPELSEEASLPRRNIEAYSDDLFHAYQTLSYPFLAKEQKIKERGAYKLLNTKDIKERTRETKMHVMGHNAYSHNLETFLENISKHPTLSRIFTQRISVLLDTLDQYYGESPEQKRRA